MGRLLRFTGAGDRSIVVHLERVDEGFLRNLDLAELAHLLFTGLLLFKQLALSRDVASVALGKHVLAQGPDSLARNHLGADGGLDGDLEQVRRDQLFELFAHRAAAALGALAMDDDRQRIDRLAVDEDRKLDEVAFLIPLDVIVERGIAARHAF